jgi:hypothetical protein
MVEKETRWVARLTATPAASIEALLAMSLGLDVWERRPDGLVVAASEHHLAELERRRLAAVERLCTVEEYVRRSSLKADSRDDQNGG